MKSFAAVVLCLSILASGAFVAQTGEPTDAAAIAKIRDEARFANLDDLIERMHLDSIEARRILSNLPSNQRELA